MSKTSHHNWPARGLGIAALVTCLLQQAARAEGRSVVDRMRTECRGTFTDLGNGSARCCYAGVGCVTCTPTGCITECESEACCRGFGLEGSNCIAIDVYLESPSAEEGDEDSFAGEDLFDAAIIDEVLLQDEPAPRLGRDLQLPPDLVLDLSDGTEAALQVDEDDASQDECEQSGGLFFELGNDATRCCHEHWGCTTCIAGVCIAECWTRECCAAYELSSRVCLADEIPETLGEWDIQDVEQGDSGEGHSFDSAIIDGTLMQEQLEPESSGTDLPAVQQPRRGRLTRSRSR